MTSPAEKITIDCPNCGHRYEDWHRASINADLDPAMAADAAAIIVAAYTGLRTGELRALRWRDVDFANATIHVRRNLPSHGAERVPKGKKVRMGHADIQTTMIYAHHIPKRNAASAFSAHVASQKGAPDAVTIAA